MPLCMYYLQRYCLSSDRLDSVVRISFVFNLHMLDVFISPCDEMQPLVGGNSLLLSVEHLTFSNGNNGSPPSLCCLSFLIYSGPTKPLTNQCFTLQIQYISLGEPGTLESYWLVVRPVDRLVKQPFNLPVRQFISQSPDRPGLNACTVFMFGTDSTTVTRQIGWFDGMNI